MELAECKHHSLNFDENFVKNKSTTTSKILIKLDACFRVKDFAKNKT